MKELSGPILMEWTTGGDLLKLQTRVREAVGLGRDVMSRVLVTGASGFIGRHLVERLVQGQREVRCLVRSADQAGTLAGTGVESVQGDVNDDASLSRALDDVDVVYHLAGRTLALSSDEFHRVNAEGTRRLAAACASMDNPPVLVFVSSLAAAGPSPPDRPRVETDPAAPISHYGRSKWLAEQALRPFAGSVPITVFRPPGVFGPRERHMLALFRSVGKGWNVVPVRSPLRMSFVHVNDLVEALILGAEKGTRLSRESETSGLYYAAFDESPTYVELGEMIGKALGPGSPRTVRLPSTVSYALAGISEIIARARRRPSLLNLDKMREATAGSWTCNPAKARRELGFRTRTTLVEGLRQTAAWYRDEGWL